MLLYIYIIISNIQLTNILWSSFACKKNWFSLALAKMYRQGICYSHLKLSLTLNFIFGYCSRAFSDLKTIVYILCWYCVRDKKVLITKHIKFGVNRKINLCWSIFDAALIAAFCPFLDYWTTKDAPRDHGIRGEFVSLRKPIVLCTIEKKILCWSMFAIEPIADFCPFLGYWLSKKFISNNDVKGNLYFMQNLKYLVPLGRYFHLDYFCQKTCSWILTPRPLEERLSTYCFQNLQKHKITLSDTDSFTLQSFIFADFKFVNITSDLKLGVPRKGNSHQDLFFKIGFLQLQLQSSKFCRTPIFL